MWIKFGGLIGRQSGGSDRLWRKRNGREPEGLARRRKTAQGPARRVRIVLAVADGLENKAIVAHQGADANTVGKWRRRFAEVPARRALGRAPPRARRARSATRRSRRSLPAPWKRRRPGRSAGACARWRALRAMRRRRSTGYGRLSACSRIARRPSNCHRTRCLWRRSATSSASISTRRSARLCSASTRVSMRTAIGSREHANQIQALDRSQRAAAHATRPGRAAHLPRRWRTGRNPNPAGRASRLDANGALRRLRLGDSDRRRSRSLGLRSRGAPRVPEAGGGQECDFGALCSPAAIFDQVPFESDGDRNRPPAGSGRTWVIGNALDFRNKGLRFARVNLRGQDTRAGAGDRPTDARNGQRTGDDTYGVRNATHGFETACPPKRWLERWRRRPQSWPSPSHWRVAARARPCVRSMEPSIPRPKSNGGRNTPVTRSSATSKGSPGSRRTTRMPAVRPARA